MPYSGKVSFFFVFFFLHLQSVHEQVSILCWIRPCICSGAERLLLGSSGPLMLAILKFGRWELVRTLFSTCWHNSARVVTGVVAGVVVDTWRSFFRSTTWTRPSPPLYVFTTHGIGQDAECENHSPCASQWDHTWSATPLVWSTGTPTSVSPPHQSCPPFLEWTATTEHIPLPFLVWARQWYRALVLH